MNWVGRQDHWLMRLSKDGLLSTRPLHLSFDPEPPKPILHWQARHLFRSLCLHPLPNCTQHLTLPTGQALSTLLTQGLWTGLVSLGCRAELASIRITRYCLTWDWKGQWLCLCRFGDLFDWTLNRKGSRLFETRFQWCCRKWEPTRIHLLVYC